MATKQEKKPRGARQKSAAKTPKRRRALLAQVKQKGQVTIPIEVRRKLGLEEGDYVEVRANGKGATITPKEVVDRHPKIDVAIDAGLRDIRAGRITPAFSNIKAFQKYRKTKSYKNFIGGE